jgi:hypothetical protein
MARYLELTKEAMGAIGRRRQTEKVFATLKTSSRIPEPVPMKAQRASTKAGVKDPFCLCGVRRSVHKELKEASCPEFRRACYQPDACRPMASGGPAAGIPVAVEPVAATPLTMRDRFNWCRTCDVLIPNGHRTRCDECLKQATRPLVQPPSKPKTKRFTTVRKAFAAVLREVSSPAAPTDDSAQPQRKTSSKRERKSK